MLYFVKQSLPVRIKSWIKPWFYRMAMALLSDEQFIKKYYQWSFGREIDLNHPRTFSEKIQYLKLNYHRENLSRLADKYEVRQYVKEQGLQYTLNQLYGVYERVEDLKFDQLPDAFVVKMTHGSGWNIICPDKSKLKWNMELDKLRGWQKENFYRKTRERIYKPIRPRLIVEKFLQDGTGTSISDYKVFCFNGKPGIIQVDCDRYTDHRRNLYDLEWKLLPWRYMYQNINRDIAKPIRLDEMLGIAQKLSRDLIFARIDLYAVQSKIIFGEVTLSPESGFGKFYPEETDLALGEKIDISSLIKHTDHP